MMDMGFALDTSNSIIKRLCCIYNCIVGDIGFDLDPSNSVIKRLCCIYCGGY